MEREGQPVPRDVPALGELADDLSLLGIIGDELLVALPAQLVAAKLEAFVRIDHILLSPGLALKLLDAGVDRDVSGQADASDHASVWATSR
ncbi:MAG: hypothetical protein JO184_16715 [Gammaproteobacteria bacterium]|nr:hypothetical protein [Gammaproteobacteria bacterium]